MLGGRASLLPVDHMLCLQKKENANDALTVLHKRDVMAHFWKLVVLKKSLVVSRVARCAVIVLRTRHK